MHELRTCDFCGADAAGTFEILPAELNPTEREQRRVVLCPTCKDRLEALLEPLLARAGADVEASSVDRNEDENARTESDEHTHRDDRESSTGDPTSAADDRTTDRGGDAPSSTTDGARDSSTALEERAQEQKQDRERAQDTHTDDRKWKENETDSDADADSDTDADSDSGDLANADATANESESDEPAESSATEETDDPDETAITVEPTDGDEDAADSTAATASETASRTESAESQTTVERPPRAYSKVIRLLRNRDFPMERAAVESLAASAYDLERHEVEAIVDHALERGEFQEVDGQLRRT